MAIPPARARPALGCKQLLAHHPAQGTQQPRPLSRFCVCTGDKRLPPLPLGHTKHRPSAQTARAGTSSAAPRHGRRDERDPRRLLLSPGSWESEAPGPVLPQGVQAPAPPPPPQRDPGCPAIIFPPEDRPLSALPSRGTRASGPRHLGSCPTRTAGPGSQRRAAIARTPTPPARPSPGRRFLPPRPQPIPERRRPWRTRPHLEDPMRTRGRAGRKAVSAAMLGRDGGWNRRPGPSLVSGCQRLS